MSFISRLFSRGKVVNDVFDKKDGHLAKIGNFIGKQQFTEEEQAIMVAGLTEAIRQHSIATLNQSTERSITTRNLAEKWIETQLALVWIAVVAGIGANINDDYAGLFNDMWLIASSDLVMYGTFGVMTYFFGAYGWGAHIKKK